MERIEMGRQVSHQNSEKSGLQFNESKDSFHSERCSYVFDFFSSSLHRSVSADSKCRCVEIFRCAKIKSERDLRGPAPFHNLLKEKKVSSATSECSIIMIILETFFCIKFVSASDSRIAISTQSCDESSNDLVSRFECQPEFFHMFPCDTGPLTCCQLFAP